MDEGKRSPVANLEHTQGIEETAQDEALRWVSAAVRQLGQSWDPEIGIDAWEAMRSPVFVRVLEWLRGSAAIVPLRNRLRQRLRTLLGPKRLLVAPRSRDSVGDGREEVAFWPTEISHVRCQLPVAAELTRLGRPPLFVASKPVVMKALVAGGARPLYAPAAWGPALRRARATAERRAGSLRKAPRPLLPPLPRGRETGRPEGAFLDLLPDVAEASTLAERLLEERGTRLLVVGNDLTLEGRAASLRARVRGLPTACLMHGAVTGSPLQSHHVADRFLVYGNASRDTLMRLGYPEARIAVVGAPHLAAGRTGADTHPAVRDLLGLRPGEPWALVATSGPGHSVSEDSHRRFVQALARIAARHPELRLVAKLHRKDRARYYEEAAARAGGLKWVPAGSQGLPDDIADWLSGCSLLVTGASSAAVDAMLGGVPVMTVDLDGELGGVDFIEAGATLHVRDETGLERELLRSLQREAAPPPTAGAARAYVEASFAARGAQAAERAAAALVELLPTVSSWPS